MERRIQGPTTVLVRMPNHKLVGLCSTDDGPPSTARQLGYIRNFGGGSSRGRTTPQSGAMIDRIRSR